MRPIILKDNCRVDGSTFVGTQVYNNGHAVPIYNVYSTNALNQLIGHVKFANAAYGNVYYRGVNGLYNNVLSSLMRNRANGIPDDLCQTLKMVCNNSYLKQSIKLQDTIRPKTTLDYATNNQIRRYNNYRVEALLQHYAGSTRFLDVVDNHWIALWMGTQKFIPNGKGKSYCQISKRNLSVLDMYERLTSDKDLLVNDGIYTYILLIAMPHSYTDYNQGIYETEEFVEVDLRKALPSIYLRPHDQHALVIRKRDKGNVDKRAGYYDMASQVTAILRVRIDKAIEWLGEGILLTKENLFPSPSIDQGYNNLLMNSERFKKPFNIIKYF